MRMKITCHDNRGSADKPFGYIYFKWAKSEWRVGYTYDGGIFSVQRTPDNLTPIEVLALAGYADKHKLVSTDAMSEMV